MKNNFFWSNIALTIGVLAILGGLGNQNFPLLFTGIPITLSSFSYKSAKKRKLGIVKTSKLRQISEIIGLVIMLLSVILQNDLLTNLYNNPIPNIIVPLWGIVAYLSIIFRNHKSENIK